MTGRQVTALLHQASIDAERDHLVDLVTVYDNAILDLAQQAGRRFALTAAADWQPPAEGWVITAEMLAAVTATMNGDLAPIWEQIIVDVGAAPLARIRIDWAITHPLAQALLDSAAQRTGLRLGEAVQPVLRKIVADAYEQGLNVAQTSAQISAAITDAAPWQADMLARTDLNSLSNGASKAAAKLTGMAFKTWDATLDDKTRVEHAEAHGQTVPMDAPFAVGGEDADYPGDPSLSDAMAANCRCTLTYGETLDEAEGLLADGSVSIMDSMASTRQRARRRLARRDTARRTVRADGAAAENPNVPGEAAPAEVAIDSSALTASARPIHFKGVAAIEGTLSDDNGALPRVLLAKSLTWDPPVPFMAQTRTAEGHMGAEVAGRIDKFRRRQGEGSAWDIEFEGDLTTPFGIDEIAPMIEDETLRGVSVDLGAAEWAIVDRETFEEIPEDELNLEDFGAGKYALGVKSAKIRAATLVPVQAIEDAKVAIAASAGLLSIGPNVENLLVFAEVLSLLPMHADLADLQTGGEVEAIVASGETWKPARHWFQTQEPPGKMPLTVTKEGRVYGHLATWDSCHTAFLPSCVPPPRSPSSYAYFHVCEIDTDEGDTLTVGKLMFSPTDGGHADRRISASKASAYYDRTGMVAAVLRVHDGQHGIWASGSLNPALTAEQRDQMRQELRLHPPSGDWRPINGQYELICGLAVAVPGYPTPRGGAEVTIVASAEGVELKDAIIASSGWFDADPAAVAALEHDGLVDEDAQAERQMRALAARAEGIGALAALID